MAEIRFIFIFSITYENHKKYCQQGESWELILKRGNWNIPASLGKSSAGNGQKYTSKTIFITFSN